jgi:hypothetical protein
MFPADLLTETIHPLAGFACDFLITNAFRTSVHVQNAGYLE